VSSRRGSVLILTLWATAALATAVISQATRLSLELRWVDRMQEAHQARYLALTGIEVAKVLLFQDDPAWDSPWEAWGKVPKEPIPFEFGTFRYQILDEQAKVPINAAASLVLSQLPGFTPQAAEELVRRRTQEQRSLTHLGELITLERDFGFQPEALSELESLVTVHGVGPVNLNSASVDVLKRIGLAEELATKILQYRDRPGRGVDGISGTADDGSFPRADPGEIQQVLEDDSGPLGDPNGWVTLGNLLNEKLVGVGSSFFHVEVEGKSSRHGIQRSVVTVLERAGTVRGWYET